jgi:hypothetical protein
LEKPPVKETTAASMLIDLVQLFERARLAREESQQLSSDYQFIVSWYRMRPRSATRPSSMVDE